MTLTAYEIQNLYNFTRKHFVEHYDLQTELVDHLANDIEELYIENPKLNFIEARDLAFKKFGVFGFMDVVTARQRAMNKRYYRYLWHYFKEWFRLPQIMVLISIFIICFISLSSVYSKYIFITSFLFLGVYCGIKASKLTKIYKKRVKRSKKKWMLEELIFTQATGFGVLFATSFNIFLNTLKVENLFENYYVVISVSVIYTVLIVLSYISLEVLPKGAEYLLKKTYPEYSLEE